MKTWLTREIMGNELWRVLVLLAGVLGGLMIGRAARYFFERASAFQAGREKHVRGAMLHALGKAAVPVLFIWGLILGLNTLVLAERFAAWVASGLDVLGILAVGYILYALIDVVDAALLGWAGRSDSKLNDMLVPMVSKSLRVTLVVLVLAQVAQALSDKPVSSILAGLGIGSLAVALAAKDTVANFFGSLVILADKPFELGERVKIGAVEGTVEALGFRSTRIRTRDGHLITYPNGELANQTIENIGKRPFIRRTANLPLRRDMTAEAVGKAVEIARELLANHEGMRPNYPPRVFFNEFKEDSLNLVIIYWYHPGDYWQHMVFAEKLNLELLSRLQAAGIELAYPTQTVRMVKE
ncbi:MAG: mechanosensitive ion channel family protein [Lentisphaerae bacterium]|jgi:MscS family membrane protein|nr:mechanosensitive ion channel family protein [Lentisphaerota bacterium]